MAQLASALAWGARGRPFKSDHPDRFRGWFDHPFCCEMFFTYIVYSQSVHKFYTGHTQDLKRRLEEHDRGKTPFMAVGKPWSLVFFKEFATRSEAMKYEKHIKKRGAGRFLSDNSVQMC